MSTIIPSVLPETYIKWVLHPKREPVLEIRDTKTNEVVRTIPVEELYRRGLTLGQMYDRRI